MIDTGTPHALAVFESAEWKVRALDLDGDPWFVAADACRSLGLTNTSMALQVVDPDDLSATEVIDSMGRAQRSNIVNESGLYELIFQSRRPEAKAFRRWVTHEVLPAIRRTGTYGMVPALPPVPRTLAEALRLAADTIDRAEAAEAQVANLTPAAQAWDTLANAEGDYSVADAAKMLCRDHGINIGRNRLFDTLDNFGWIYRGPGVRRQHCWHAYQTAVDAGRLAERANTYRDADGTDRTADPQIRITAKGLADLLKRLSPPPPLQLVQSTA